MEHHADSSPVIAMAMLLYFIGGKSHWPIVISDAAPMISHGRPKFHLLPSLHLHWAPRLRIAIMLSGKRQTQVPTFPWRSNLPFFPVMGSSFPFRKESFHTRQPAGVVSIFASLVVLSQSHSRTQSIHCRREVQHCHLGLKPVPFVLCPQPDGCGSPDCWPAPTPCLA